MRRFLMLFCCIVIAAPAQEWKRYTAANSGLISDLVYAITITRDGTIWAGTSAGLASFNGTNWITYDTANSPLPDPYITALAADTNNVLWIGMGFGGTARLSNGVWTFYDSSNSDLPHNTVHAVTIGPDNTPWFATENGVVNFNGTTWRSIAPIMIEPRSRSVAFDRQNVLWMGTYDATDFRGYVEYLKGDSLWFTILSKLDIISTHAWSMVPSDDSTMYVGTGNGLARVVNGRWTIFHKQDSPLPANGVRSLSMAGDTVLIGTASGYVELSGNEWNVFLPSAGGVPNDVVTGIAVDRNGKRWLATSSSGIVTYRPSGISTRTPDAAIVPGNFTFHQNYPNPFNPSTTFRYSVGRAGHLRLVLFDALGREVAVLVNGMKDPGEYTVNFSANDLAGGVYYACLTSSDRTETRKVILMK